MYNCVMQRIVNNFKRKEVRKELRKNQTPQEVILWARYELTKLDVNGKDKLVSVHISQIFIVGKNF